MQSSFPNTWKNQIFSCYKHKRYSSQELLKKIQKRERQQQLQRLHRQSSAQSRLAASILKLKNQPSYAKTIDSVLQKISNAQKLAIFYDKNSIKYSYKNYRIIQACDPQNVLILKEQEKKLLLKSMSNSNSATILGKQNMNFNSDLEAQERSRLLCKNKSLPKILSKEAQINQTARFSRRKYNKYFKSQQPKPWKQNNKLHLNPQ